MSKVIRFNAYNDNIYSIVIIKIFNRKHHSFMIFLHIEVVPLDNFNT